MNTDEWDRKKICSYLHQANQGIVRYSEVEEAIKQAKSFITKYGEDPIIQDHLNNLIPKLGSLKHLDEYRKKLDKAVRNAFRNSLLGVLVGAVLGICGSIYTAKSNISAQYKISGNSSQVYKEMSANIATELSKINQSLKSSNHDCKVDIDNIRSQIKDIDMRIKELEKKK